MHVLFPRSTLLCAVIRAVPRSCCNIDMSRNWSGSGCRFYACPLRGKPLNGNILLIAWELGNQVNLMQRGTCDSRFFSLKGFYGRFVVFFVNSKLLKSRVMQPVTRAMETYVKWSGAYEWVNDFCNVIWWIIYEPQSSGDHQQVTGESTAVLKRITDNSNRFDRQTAKKDWCPKLKSTSLSLSVPLSRNVHLFQTRTKYCNNGPLLLIWPSAVILFFSRELTSSVSVSLSRWTVFVAGSLAGGGEARRGVGMPQAVCVLPHAHDGQLPIPEHHHSAGWCAIWLTTCFPAEQPHHRASRRLFWLRDTGKMNSPAIFAGILNSLLFLLSHPTIFSPFCAGALAVWQQYHMDRGRSLQ